MSETILSYPYDATEISQNAKALRQALWDRAGESEVRIAILGGASTHHLKVFLELFLLKKGQRAQFWESGFDQYFHDATSGNDRFKKFDPQITIVHTSSRNILEYPSLQASDQEVQALANAEIEKLVQVWQGIHRQTTSVILQNNWDFPALRVLGNLDGIHNGGKLHFVRKLNEAMNSALKSHPGVHLHDLNYLAALVGLDEWHDENWWHLYKYSSSLKSLPFIAESLSAMVMAILGRSKKNLILDLDNTLWDGVIGEVGAGGIQIGADSPSGEAHRDFQIYCRELKARGILLSIASKNDVKNAEAGFSKRESILKIEDFSSIKINWGRKDQNISEISEDLELDPSSFVFVDDSPAERELVKQSLPTVAVLDVNEASAFARNLDRNYFFESASISKEDTQRSELYRQKSKSQELRKQFTNYDDYLKSLDQELELRVPDSDRWDRVSQLINKTNQFNLTNKKVQLEEIKLRCKSRDSLTVQAHLRDRFGDHGVISVVMAEISGESASIDVWVMSCRVLNRGIEKALLDEIVRLARTAGVKTLTGHYLSSDRNQIVEGHYSALGFKAVKSQWILDIGTYKNQNRLINVVHAF